MTNSTFHFPAESGFEFTGERYVPAIYGEIQAEHYHRYLFALRFVTGRDVLDIASGEGYGSALLGQAARSVTGVDIDPASVTHAIERYSSPTVSFQRGNATAIPCGDSSVDVCVSFETIEHLGDHQAFLSEVRRVLRPDGVLVISTPDSPLYNAPRTEDNRYHVKELTREQFAQVLREQFAHVRVFEQKALAGSVILDAGRPSEGVDYFESEDNVSFRRAENTLQAPYLVALASDSELPAVPPSIMAGTFGSLSVPRASSRKTEIEMHHLKMEIETLQRLCAELQQKVEVDLPRLEKERDQLLRKLNGDEAAPRQVEALRRAEEQQRELEAARLYADLARAENRYLRDRLNVMASFSAPPQGPGGSGPSGV